MAATAYHSGAPMVPEPTDLAGLWNGALQKYREESETELPVTDMNMILAEQERQLLLFGQFRHNKGKLDKLRSVVSRNSELLQSLASKVANAASTAFPPSSAILTAFNLVMNASKAVSEDYEMIVSFFDIMNSFLERISMLEKKLPPEWQYQNALVNVFAALLTLCAIARKYRQKGRMLKWAKALVDGQDPKLKGAFNTLHTQMERLESATVIATLKVSIESGQKLDGMGRDLKNIQVGVNMSLELGQQNLSIGQQSYYLGLETRGYVKNAAVAGTEIITMMHRQEDTGAEQTGRLRNIERALQKSSRDKGPVGQQMDAGARRSAALKQVQRLLAYDLDGKAQLADLESSFVTGTCEWFRGLDEYNEFEAGEIPLLWVTGPSGVGKSTLASWLASILREEFQGEGGTSVAHFFFREDLEEFGSVDRMLRSCATQIAVNDVKYRESILASMQRGPGFSINYTDVEDLWRLLFRLRFTKESKRRLFLVLDGVDEADEAATEHLAEIFSEISTSSDLQIRVIFTSSPDYIVGAEQGDSLKIRRFEMDKEKIKPDLKKIALARLRTLGRLRKLTKKTKRKIKDRLINQADTIRYLEHILRRLNAIGREKAVLRELDNLPANTKALYELLLDDAQKSRSEEDKEVLRKLFAWLAYSKQPLSLGSASHLLNFIAKDNDISIDEELEHGCARILRLSNAAQDGDEETDSDIDSQEDEKKADDEEDYFPEDLNVLVGFQELAMRSYFREPDIEEGGLRSCPSVGNMMIFEVIGNILTEDKKPTSDDHGWLYSYAANRWLTHLLEIKPGALTQLEKARVIETLCGILTNRNGALRMIEEWTDDTWDGPSVFGETDEYHEKALKALQEWSSIAKELPPILLSPFTLSWIRPFAQNPKTIYIKLADAHVTNWLTSVDMLSNRLCSIAFRFAHRALELGRDLLSMKQDDELRAYFEERTAADSMASTNKFNTPFTERSYMIVSKAFLHIDKTAQSYKNIGKALKWNNLLEESLKQFELGLRVSNNDRDSIQLYSEMADALIHRAQVAEAEAMASKHEADDSIEPDEEEQDDSPSKAPKGEANGTRPDLGAEGGEQKKTKQKTKQQWAQEACDILSKATALNLTVSKSEDEDREVRRAVIDSWSYRATAELLLGNTEHVIEYITKAHAAKSKVDYVACDNIFEALAEKQEWAKILDLLRLQDHANTWLYLYYYHEQVHRAAKETGQADYIIEVYTQAASQNLTVPAELLHAQWASFYQTVLGGDRISEAKPLLHKIMETSDSSILIFRASFSLADIFLEEFRATRDPGRKEAAFIQMQALVRRIKEIMGNEFDPTQSQTTIPLALMTRRLNALDFQRGLEATFRGCVEALTDNDCWNDSVSFRTLAKVLACVPGLKVEAEVAATCQLYIIDMVQYKKDSNIISDSAPESPEPEENELAENGGEPHDEEGAAAVNGAATAAVEDESKSKTEPTTDGTSAELPTGDTKSDLPNVDEKSTEEEDMSTVEDEPEGEEDLDLINGNLSCKNCGKIVCNWHDGVMYLCYYCTELNLCGKCYDEKLDRESGKLPPDWRVLCPAGHRHVRAPVAGWKGLKGGVLKFEDKEVPFQDWLAELKEKKWVEAWDRFWADELR